MDVASAEVTSMSDEQWGDVMRCITPRGSEQAVDLLFLRNTYSDNLEEATIDPKRS